RETAGDGTPGVDEPHPRARLVAGVLEDDPEGRDRGGHGRHRGDEASVPPEHGDDGREFDSALRRTAVALSRSSSDARATREVRCLARMLLAHSGITGSEGRR